MITMTRELWRDLLLSGWIPPPCLWLRTDPIDGECALLWLMEENEPFEHGMNAEGYFDGEEWIDFDSTPVEGHGMTVAAWCHTPGVQQYAGHDEIDYFKRMLDNFPAGTRAAR